MSLLVSAPTPDSQLRYLTVAAAASSQYQAVREKASTIYAVSLLELAAEAALEAGF